jgi:hypothetical protein
LGYERQPKRYRNRLDWRWEDDVTVPPGWFDASAIGTSWAAVGATQPAWTIAQTAVDTSLQRVRAAYGYNCLRDDGTDTKMIDVAANNAYGDAIVKKTTGNCFYHFCKFDQDFPVPGGSSNVNPTAYFAAWQAGTNVPIYYLATHPSGATLICSQAGVTGGGSPTLQNYSTPIQDGTAQWQLVSGVTRYFGIDFEGSSSQCIVSHSDVTFAGLSSIRINSTGASFMLDGNTLAIASVLVYASSGSLIQVRGGTIGGALRAFDVGGNSFGVLIGDGCGGQNIVEGVNFSSADYLCYFDGNTGAATVVDGNSGTGARIASFTGVPGIALGTNNW